MTQGFAPRQPLTPHAALGWLRSLSIDIEAAAVLDADGEVLAGDRSLAGAQAASGLTIARSDRRAIVLRVGPRALERLVRADVEAALEAVESR